MKIDSVDFFYLAMPEVTIAADGSQDALVVRVSAGGHVGWGECEASPLASIAAFVTPMSHGACRPVSASVLGETLDGPDDIRRMATLVAYNSMDLLQAAHTWSGIEMALWDLLGHARGEPTWKLLGYERAYPKTPYASVLFGTTPQETLERARGIRADGFRAAKFGWAPFGDSLQGDIAPPRRRASPPPRSNRRGSAGRHRRPRRCGTARRGRSRRRAPDAPAPSGCGRAGATAGSAAR